MARTKIAVALILMSLLVASAVRADITTRQTGQTIPETQGTDFPAEVSLARGEGEPMRETINLDGTWGFELDEAGRGIQEKWYDGHRTLASSIRVPGAWQAQQFGKPGGKLHLLADWEVPADYLRWHSEGIGWYCRDVEAPASWKDRLVWLKVGLALRYTDAYVNGVHVGTHQGISTPSEFEISRHLRFGEANRIVLAIDNRPRPGKSLLGCMNYMGNWGGIGRSVCLQPGFAR